MISIITTTTDLSIKGRRRFQLIIDHNSNFIRNYGGDPSSRTFIIRNELHTAIHGGYRVDFAILLPLRRTAFYGTNNKVLIKSSQETVRGNKSGPHRLHDFDPLTILSTKHVPFITGRTSQPSHLPLPNYPWLLVWPGHRSYK